jgi:undecaprenyl-diphosphatase
MAKNKKSSQKRPILNPTVQLFAAISLFVFSVQISRGGHIASWEASLFQLVYDLPRFLYWPFMAITHLGSFYVLGILAVMYLIRRRHYHNLLRLLLTGLLAYVATGFAKDIWGRGRPFELLPEVVSLEFVVRGPGFPSGHMALAAALALTVGHYLPRKYHWLPVVWIVGVGLSRMYLGVHTPVDIIGGFAIGWGAYALFRHVRLYDISYGRNSVRRNKKVGKSGSNK